MESDDQRNGSNGMGEGRLIWIDLEMTGLDTVNDSILEIATVVTDAELNILAEGPELAIAHPLSTLQSMDDWNRRQHGKSGLWQRVLEEGGYKKKGKTPEQSAGLLEGALALVEAGVFAIVLESVVPATAEWLTSRIPVPTIGIGCGEHTCDGEVAVATDLIGTFPWFVPPFAKPEADLAPQITAAAAAYRQRVQSVPIHHLG